MLLSLYAVESLDYVVKGVCLCVQHVGCNLLVGQITACKCCTGYQGSLLAMYWFCRVGYEGSLLAFL